MNPLVRTIRDHPLTIITIFDGLLGWAFSLAKAWGAGVPPDATGRVMPNTTGDAFFSALVTGNGQARLALLMTAAYSLVAAILSNADRGGLDRAIQINQPGKPRLDGTSEPCSI